MSPTSLFPVIREWCGAALRLCYPPACEFCGEGLDEGPLCAACRDRFLHSGRNSCCGRCGAEAGPHLNVDEGCPLCRQEHFAFERVIRLGRYDGVMADACHRIKQPPGCRLATALVGLLVDREATLLESLDVDLVAPVPLYWLRRWRRGYDQSAHLAQAVAARLRKPMDDRSLRRIRATATQHHLSPTKRKENVRNAFAVAKRRRLDGKKVLLVDDVLTTGSTCHQAARALKSAGASRVVCLVLARGDKIAGVQSFS